MTVDPDALTGSGIALTLTVRDCPASSQEWAKIVADWLQRVRRMRPSRFHWVVEWQKRGAPHLHASVYFDDDEWDHRHGARLARHWEELTRHLGTLPRGQHFQYIENAEFWGRYVSKHACRGAAHYQRQQGLLPPGWQSSGRMWGKGGSWPTWEADFECDELTYQRFRRFIRRWRRSKALELLARGRRYRNPHQVREALQALRHTRRGPNTKRNSRVVGLGTYCPPDVSRRLLWLAMDHAEGYLLPFED